MKVIIAGSRSITDYKFVLDAIKNCPFNNKITEVVSGGARGVDQLGERWAKENHVPYRIFPAPWKEKGRSAGMIRNNEMAEYSDALIAVWDGRSKGTGHMIKEAKARGLKVFVWVV